MRPPDEFFRDYERALTHLDWARRNLAADEKDFRQLKLVREEWAGVLAKWRPRIQLPVLVQGLDEMTAWVERVGHLLERAWLEALQPVLAARLECCRAEAAVRISFTTARVMRDVPPDFRLKLEALHREHFECEFEAPRMIGETEALAEEAEAQFRRELAALEIHWPERMDDALRERLRHLDKDAFAAWSKEITGALATLPPDPAAAPEP